MKTGLLILKQSPFTRTFKLTVFLTALTVLPNADLVAQSTSKLWGADGSKWTPESRLPDFSFAGYHCGESPIPNLPVAANVKDFGAKGDGKTDDSEAIKKAIEATPHGVILIPAGRYVLTEQLAINRSGIVLRGEGIGRTVFYIPKSLEEIHGSAKVDGNKSAWSFSGGFVEFRGEQKGDKLADVTSAAKRGDTKLELSQTEGITPGTWLRLVMNNDPALGRHLHADQADAGPATLDECRHLCDWVARVKAIEGNVIVLDRPLRLDVKAEWAPEVHSWQPQVEDVGLEGITFEFKGSEKKPHLEEEGFNAVQMNDAVNCWVRNIEVIDGDCGVIVSGSRFCTIEGLQARTANRRAAETGHHALWANRGAQDCLFSGFRIKTTYAHDLSVEGLANGNVFEAGEALAIAFDHHASAPYENLFTQIQTGDPVRFWNSSGRGDRGPHTGARTTFWNVDYKRGVLPPVPDWPQINVIGVKRAGSSSNGKRNEWIESVGNINPPNLYRAQLQRRLKTNSGQMKTSFGGSMLQPAKKSETIFR